VDDLGQSLGLWASSTYVVLGVAYVITLVAGFISNRNLNDPLKDPHLAIAELLILVMAPVMVAIAVAIHTTSSAEDQPYALMSLAWMIAAAGTTSIVHFVELTVARRVDHATLPGYDRVFGWRWPSVLYAIDIVAWDIFFAFALLFAVPAVEDTAARVGLVASGVLSLVGLVGPATNRLAWRHIGIFGYAVVFPVACISLFRYFDALG
jgi:hypothetical protein